MIQISSILAFDFTVYLHRWMRFYKNLWPGYAISDAHLNGCDVKFSRLARRKVLLFINETQLENQKSV